MTRYLLYGVWTLLAATLLAGCGDSDDPEDRPTTQPTTPSAAAVLDYDALSQLSVGAPAPDFSLPSTDGSVVSLSDYQGQPVLLYFHMAVG